MAQEKSAPKARYEQVLGWLALAPLVFWWPAQESKAAAGKPAGCVELARRVQEDTGVVRIRESDSTISQGPPPTSTGFARPPYAGQFTLLTMPSLLRSP